MKQRLPFGGLIDSLVCPRQTCSGSLMACGSETIPNGDQDAVKTIRSFLWHFIQPVFASCSWSEGLSVVHRTYQQLLPRKI
jgi:hypothetical protein